MANPTTSDDAHEFDTEKYILFRLASDGGGQVWLVSDLERERENAPDVEDALARLERAGLIYRFDDGRLVVATRAGIVSSETYAFSF